MIALFDYDKYNLIMESSFKFKGYDFLYFDEGVPFYSLFRTTRKLNSFWEMKYVAEKLLYLNPNIKIGIFKKLMYGVSDGTNGHTVRSYSKKRINEMCDYEFDNRKIPYVRKYRKIIFNPVKVIPNDDKRYVVGLLSGRSTSKRVTVEVIYHAYEELAANDRRITYKRLSSIIGCTRQTVSNNMSEEIKELIHFHNSGLQS